MTKMPEEKSTQRSAFWPTGMRALSTSGSGTHIIPISVLGLLVWLSECGSVEWDAHDAEGFDDDVI